MENSRPGPDETEKSSTTKSAKAEGVAAWLSRQRDNERHIIFGEALENKKDDSDKDESAKKAKRLRLGGLPIVAEESPKEGGGSEVSTEVTDLKPDINIPEAEDRPEGSELPGEYSAEPEDRAPVYEATAELVSTAEMEHQEAAEEQAANRVEQDFRAWEDELQTASSEEEDFKKWEQEFQTVESQTSADLQMEANDEDPNAAYPVAPPRSVHGPRATPSTRLHGNAARARYAPPYAPAPVPAAGGGGGGGNIVPPVPGGPGNPNNPNNPFGPYGNPNTGPISSANVVPLPVNPNVVLGGVTPNKVTDHEHRHGHPRLALAMAAGLLVEHMLGKRADKRIDAEMRKRTDKLREQIEQTQASQDEARRNLQEQQMRVVAEQDRQRQTVEAQSVAVATQAAANRLQPSARPSAEVGAKAHRTVESGRQFGQTEHVEASPEDIPIIGTDAYAEAQARPKVVMEQVAAAAENDVPVERVYERRQEVRDEPSSPAGAAAGGAMAGAGSTLGSGSGQYNAPVSDQGAQRSASTQKDSHESELDYRAAAARGIGGALALIVLAAIAYLVF
jgi:hypothetical protein